MTEATPPAPSPRRRGGRAAVLSGRKGGGPIPAPRPRAPKAPVLVLACGAIAREIRAVIAANRLHHLDLLCLPAELHLRPDRITEAVTRAVTQHRGAYDRIFVAYADCGTGGALSARCAELGVEMIAGPHCYAFFDGVETHAARQDQEFRAFYLTDFLARQFDAFVWQAMGLDRHPELCEIYFAHYDRLIYLAQTDDPALDHAAQEAAARLGLRYERRLTGYGDLAAALLRA